MSSPLETQAKVWVDTLSSEETVETYKSVFQTLATSVQALWDAIKVTWNIIKETGKLLWLFICFGLVAFDWIWDGSTRLVEKAKNVTAEAGDPKSDTYFADAGKALLDASKGSAVKAVAQAREQLGLPKNERPAPAPKAAAPKTPAAPAVPAPPKAETVAKKVVEAVEEDA